MRRHGRPDEFMDKFKDFMGKYRRSSMRHGREGDFTSATVADVYVAINSQYHDYAELFKNWFGDGIEQKIVESAIVFWFKDADCKAENKVVEYLREY